MSVFWMFAIFLLFWRCLAEFRKYEGDTPEFVQEIMHNGMPFDINHPTDFRCWQFALRDFTLSEFPGISYDQNPQKVGCSVSINGRGKKRIFYPPPTGLDPMMTFYIQKIYEGIELVALNPEDIESEPSIIKRRRDYCTYLRMIGSTFVEYFETYQSDDETCWRMKEIVKECTPFRQIWFIWVKPLSERFCLGEDGCYRTMELYEDEMPHCVKYIVKSQFQNVTFGSWHHSIINYCQLTDMVPGAKDIKYDRPVLFEDDKTEDDLLAMCQFLRFRLLPEEGKEEEIREITLEERDSKGTDTNRNSATSYSDRAIYVALMILIYNE